MPLSRQPLALRLAMQFLSQWSTSSLGKTEASSSNSLLSLTSSWVTCLSRSGSSGTILEILFSLTERGGGQKFSSDWVELNCRGCEARNKPQVVADLLHNVLGFCLTARTPRDTFREDGKMTALT